jgi:two-component system OmpR family sensor kinase/two-component system sensor histidine kinase BaeS
MPRSRCHSDFHERHAHWAHAAHFDSNQRMRLKWFRRIALAVLLMLLLAVAGVFSLASLITTELGVSGWWGPVVITIVVFIAIFFATHAFGQVRRAGGPLGAVMDAAGRVADGDYTARVDERGPPPLRALAHSFNRMTERLALADRQRRDLMADLAHELRTPLSVLQGRMEGMLDGIYRPSSFELEQLLDQTRVLSRLVEDLRTLALSEAGVLNLQKESTDLSALLRDVVHSFDAEAKRKTVSLSYERPPDAAAGVSFILDPVRIREVVSNLLSNALRHTPAEGSVVVSLTLAADGATISVRDTGDGMSAENVARMFQRFHKGADSHGAGLGLAIAKHLVIAHRGEISATSEPNKGTTVTFTLPRDE